MTRGWELRPPRCSSCNSHGQGEHLSAIARGPRQDAGAAPPEGSLLRERPRAGEPECAQRPRRPHDHVPTGCANGIGRTRPGCLTSHAGREPMSHTHLWAAPQGRCSATLGSTPRTCPAITGNSSHGRGTDCRGSVEPVGVSIRSSCPGARRCERMSGFLWERHSPGVIRAPLDVARASRLPPRRGSSGSGVSVAAADPLVDLGYRLLWVGSVSLAWVRAACIGAGGGVIGCRAGRAVLGCQSAFIHAIRTGNPYFRFPPPLTLLAAPDPSA